jgi:hypothetical protein
VLVDKKDGSWQDGDFAAKSDFNKGRIASPLVVDGLLYRLSEGGGLIVNDLSSGEVVYCKVLLMKTKTAYWAWFGTHRDYNRINVEEI